ncbi:MAG: hypothetical protein JJE47_13365 [Acidimicrobiia bacterium]|nr:hypothetical protein [Acidimicrobiia bacterium]
MTLGDDTENTGDEPTVLGASYVAPIVSEPATPESIVSEPTREYYGEPYGLTPEGDSPAPTRSRWRMMLDIGRIFGHGFGAILDIGMMIIGVGLLSIAIATLLDGFGVGEPSLTDNSGAMFGSALLVGVFGSFALGVANEGPLTSPREGENVGLIESNAARAVSILVVVAAVGWVAGLLPTVLESLPTPFTLATTVIEETGRAGLFFGLLMGVPLAVLLRMWKPTIREDADFAIIFVVWLLGTILLVNRVLPSII